MKWGAVTLVLCLARVAIPLPFLRMLLACAVAVVLMMVSKNTYYYVQML